MVVVQPPPNRGASALVPVKRSPISGKLQIEFQRQTYYYQPAEVLAHRKIIKLNATN